MNYKYGIAIFLGLLLASISMSKVATAALITYDITVNYDNVDNADFGFYFEGSIIIDTTQADSNGLYALGDTDWTEYNSSVLYDGEVTDFAKGVPGNTLGNGFTMKVTLDTDFKVDFTEFILSDVRSGTGEVTVRYRLGCNPAELVFNGVRNRPCREDENVVLFVPFGLRGVDLLTYDAEIINVSGDDSQPRVTVPEPYPLTLFALGMIGLASRRFKKQS